MQGLTSMTQNSGSSEMWKSVSLNSDEGEQSVTVGDAELHYVPMNSMVNPGMAIIGLIFLSCKHLKYKIFKKSNMHIIFSCFLSNL